MWLPDRRKFIGVLFAGGALGLAACGFSPVYAPGGTGAGLRGAVTVDAPEDRESYEFVKALEGRLGRNLSAPYRLSYDITTQTQGLGVTPSQEITRTQIQGAVTFKVIAVGSGVVVHEGSVSNFTSYSSEGSTVSTATVERDAYRRLMVSLANQITTRLMATYSGWEK